MVALGVLVCVTVAVVYVLKAPKVYTPTATLYVDANGLHLLGKDKEQSAADAESYLNRQCELIRSERVVRLAIDGLPPADIAAMYPGSADPVTDVRNVLSVTVGKKDDVITVALGSGRPDEGARLVNGIVAAYQASEKQQAHKMASEAVDILQADKQREEQALDDKQRQIVDFKQKHGEMFFTNDRGENITIQNLATISDQVTRARLYETEQRGLFLQSNGQLPDRTWREAAEQTRQLQSLYQEEKANALQINAALADYQRMQSDADRTIKQLDLLDARIRELDVTQEGGPDIRVVEAAKVERYPTSPKKAVALLAAVAVGGALGCGLAVLRDVGDQRLRTPAQAARLLGTPVLGVIPEVPGTGGPDERLRLARITHIRPDGEVAGAFSSLAAEVCYGRPFRDGRLLLVTSPNRGDGKSTVAANLAIAAAHAGRRTLLLDADFRRPIQHLVFDVQGNLGVADVVLDGFGIDQVVRPTDVRGLFLLPAGALAGNPVELIGGRPFAELLAGLEERFDLVVIDAPPLLATGDARVLAAHADGAIVVLRAERSTRQAARLACERVLGVGCTLLGLAFNGDDAVATAPHADGRGANDDWVAAAPVRRSPFHRAAAIAPGLIPAVAIATVDRDGVTERLHNGLQATSGGGRVARGPGVV